MKGPPELLASAVEHGQPVGIMYRRSEVVDILAVVRSEKEHASHRHKAGALQIYSGIDRHFHVEDGRIAGPDGETIGRRRALAVEQGVHDNGFGVGCRLFDPECLERREFFALGFAGVDRKSARRKTIQLPLGDSPKIARAEKDANLVIIVGLVDWCMEPKAGKAEIDTWAWRRQVPE